MKSHVIATCSVFFFVGLTQAGIPEPEVIVYGTLMINGKPVKSNDAVTIGAFVRNGETEIVRYRMGDNILAGNNYVLRIPLESVPSGTTPSGNAAVLPPNGSAIVKIKVLDERTLPGTEIFVEDYVVSGRGIIANKNYSVTTELGIPKIASWEIMTKHGANDISIRIAEGHVESRACGVSRLRLVFDRTMDKSVVDPSAISIERITEGAMASPACNVTWEVDGTAMTVLLCSSLPDDNTFTITVGRTFVSAEGIPLGGDRTICLSAVAGDANRDHTVSAQDLPGIRANIGKAVDPANARYDIDCTGTINEQDLSTARSHIGGGAQTCR